MQFVYMTYEIDGEQHTQATDLGYHSPRPMYPGQRCMGLAGDCHAFRAPHRGVADCYYDGSGLNARPVLEALQEYGEGAVWPLLRDYYFEVFWENEDDPWNAGYIGEPYQSAEETRARMIQIMRDLSASTPEDDPMMHNIRAVIAAYEKEIREDPDVAGPPEEGP